MSLPTNPEIENGLIKLLLSEAGAGYEMYLSDVYQRLATYFKLTDAQKKAVTSEGRSLWENRLRTAKARLIDRRILHPNPGRGLCKLLISNVPQHYLQKPSKTEAKSPPENKQDTKDKDAKTGQGFQVSTKVRLALEQKAMEMAIDYFQSRGWNVKDVSKNASYDLNCTLDEKELHVEVKGTTTEGSQILLTPNEVEHAQQNYPDVALFIVSSLEVAADGDAIEISGGNVNLTNPWLLEDDRLQPAGYTYQVPEK